MTEPYRNFFVLIPAKNEAKSLPYLLKEIKNNVTENIVIVDNDSTDETYQIAKQFTKHVVKEKKPGYGNASLAGIKYLSGIFPMPDFICFFDGDGQSIVSDIPKIMNTLQSSESLKYCHGSRMNTYLAKINLTGSAFVANKVFSLMLSKIWRIKITDLGPLRCIDFILLNKLQMKSKTYGWTIEMNTKLAKLRVPMCEVPVSYIRRSSGISKISGSFKTSIKAATVMSFVLLKTALFWRIERND